MREVSHEGTKGTKRDETVHPSAGTLEPLHFRTLKLIAHMGIFYTGQDMECNRRFMLFEKIGERNWEGEMSNVEIRPQCTGDPNAQEYDPNAQEEMSNVEIRPQMPLGRRNVKCGDTTPMHGENNAEN